MSDPFAQILADFDKSEGLRPEPRSKAFAQAKRHSNFVRFLKFVLPISAIAISAGFAFVTLQARTGPSVSIASAALENGRIVMENPRLNGSTGDNQPYSLIAARALQSTVDVNDILLEGITAQMPFGTGNTAQLIAPNGHLDNGKRILTLPAGFNLTSSDGMVAKFEGAVFDFGARSLKSEMPVDIKRQGTHILADSMVITEGGASMIFERRVRMIITPESLRQTGEPANGG
ncbi:MAG: LPS export ABC transporter periplasmic protein LptC [Notoacmeibacter sp.]